MNYIIYLFLIIFSFLLMTIYDLYAAFLLAVLLMALPLIALGLGVLSQKQISCQLSHPASARRGQTVELDLTVHGSVVPFLSSLTAFVNGKEYDAYEEGKKNFHFIFQEELPHCGRISFSKVYAAWKDPFGFFHFHASAAPSTMLVLPKRIGEASAIKKQLFTAHQAEELEYFGATEYKPGDNPHLINWKITARKDDVYVRDSAPASQAQIALAADYDKDETCRDTIGDALYSAGLVLVSSHIPFHFVWATEKGRPVTLLIQSEKDWQEAISAFLWQGGNNALANPSLSPSLPVCYITGNTRPVISSLFHPTIWCAREGNTAATLSGRAALLHALGGPRS